MATVDILYIVLIVSIAVITVTLVWLANDTRGLIKSLKRSADDTAAVTKEIREKVMMVSEALDRAGAAATTVIGLIESAIEQIKEKRDMIANSIGVLTGAGKAVKDRSQDLGLRSQEKEEKEELQEDKSETPAKKEINEKHEKGEKIEMPVKKETKLAKTSKQDESKPAVDSVGKPEKKKEEEREADL